MRRCAALLLTLCLASLVVACGDDEAAPADESSSSSTAPAEPLELASSDLGDIELTGAAGEKPELEFPLPFGVEATERRIISEGDGDLVALGTTVEFHFLFLNARDGSEIESSYEADPAQVAFTDDLMAGVFSGLDGLPAGTRAVTAIAPSEGLGEDPTVGLVATDTVLFVVEILAVRTPLTRAEGEAVAPVDGLPTVVLADDGNPTITVPDVDPPAELIAQELIKGAGAEVEAGQTITVHYRGVLFADGMEFDSSWERGSPASFGIGSGQVIQGWDEGLVGRTIGSQVLLVVPPDKGYPEGTPDGSIGPGETLVFVIDILDAS